MKKVIFLAFANSARDPLPYLTEEDRGIYDILLDRSFSGDYNLYRESYSTPESISKYLDKYKDSLAVFHFSGHAGDNLLLVNDQIMNSTGIAAQLAYSAKNGVLKLVVLNGCATAGQVEALQKIGVPAIVSTSAPVNDKSAKEFSLRFWQKMVKEDRTISEAYLDALAVGQSNTQQDLSSAKERTIINNRKAALADANKPLWQLSGITDDDMDSLFPIPVTTTVIDQLPPPNLELVEALYESFNKAGNPEIVELHEKEKRNLEVSLNTKQTAIVNTIPFPIGIHLQKLICPAPGDEGYNVFGLRRLQQIVQFFQITTEFLGIVMIAQMWELYLRKGEDFLLTENVKTKLKEYLGIRGEARQLYDYIPLIQTIREYLEDLEKTKPDLKKFIDEQELIKDLFQFDDNFKGACNYFSELRNRTANSRIDEERAKEICYEAEQKLCVFVEPLGFIHRYQLTSIQQIDILKLRHIQKEKTQYKHRIMKCMQALGYDVRSYYYMNTFLDNWGVILLKCQTSKIQETNKKNKYNKYSVIVTDYLNLTPFVIDWNSFIDKADLIDIMFFKAESNNELSYQRVKQPTNPRDTIAVNKQEADDDFDPIRIQFNAFKEFIA